MLVHSYTSRAPSTIFFFSSFALENDAMMVMTLHCWGLPCLFLHTLRLVILSHVPQAAIAWESDGQQAWLRALHEMIPPETIDKVNSDKQLRRNYVAVVNMLADASRHLGQRYEVPELAIVSNDLSIYLEELGANTDTTYRLDAKPPSPVPNSTPGLSRRQNLLGGLTGVLGNITSGFGDLLSGAAGSVLGGIGNITLAALPSAGFFLGVGVAEGAAQGLNITSGNMSRAVGAMVAQENSMQNTELNPAIEKLGIGLTATLLKSVGTTKLVGGNLDIGRIANGFAQGVVTGAGDAVDAMGGVNALINGTATMPTDAIPQTNLTFNDTVGGAAVGFGQGLGSSGTLVLQKLLAGGPNATIPGSTHETVNGVSTTKSVSTRSAIIRRQTPPSLNVSGILSAATLSTVTQKGIDVLTCEGVGGLGLVGFGLMKSGAVSLGGFDQKVTRSLTTLIPQGTIHFTNGRNSYDIVGQDVAKGLDGDTNAAANGVSVNGMKVIPFVVLLILHSKSFLSATRGW